MALTFFRHLRLRPLLPYGGPLDASRRVHLDLRGIFPPIVTPFRNDESIAYDKLQLNFDKWKTIPFRGYLIHGSNGEYVTLTMDERVEMVKHVRSLVPKDRLLLVGSGCESTRATIQLSELFAEAGADAAVVVTPSFFKNRLTTDALVRHYEQVADASSVPVILYSVPANTGVDLSVEVIVTLAKHPNIIGLKDSGGDVTKLGAILSQVPFESFQVLAGSAGFLLPAYSIGCVGGVCALANALGEELCQLHKMVQQASLAEASDMQRRLVVPNSAVTKQFGVPGLKYAMEMFGYYGGPPRRPVLPLKDAEKKAVTDIFKSSGFI